MTFSPLILSGGQQKRLQSSEILTTNPCAGRLNRSGNQSVLANTLTQVIWNGTTFSSRGTFWSNASEQEKLRFPYDGIYVVGANVRVTQTTAGEIYVALLSTNPGTSYPAYERLESSLSGDFSLTTVLNASTSDRLGLAVRTASASNIISVTEATPNLWAVRIG